MTRKPGLAASFTCWLTLRGPSDSQCLPAGSAAFVPCRRHPQTTASGLTLTNNCSIMKRTRRLGHADLGRDRLAATGNGRLADAEQVPDLRRDQLNVHRPGRVD